MTDGIVPRKIVQ